MCCKSLLFLHLFWWQCYHFDFRKRMRFTCIFENDGEKSCKNWLENEFCILPRPHSICAFPKVRRHKLVRKLKTLPGREILLYGIGFGKREQSERERECCWPDDGSQCKSQLALDSSWASAVGQPHFFLLSFFTLQDDICKCRDFQPMILKEYFD